MLGPIKGCVAPPRSPARENSQGRPPPLLLPEPRLPPYGRRGDGNLSVCMRYGDDLQHRLLSCATCTDRFSERKGTPRFDTRLPRDRVLALLAHLADGCGVRQTARLVGVGKDTVTRLARLAGDHARRLPDELVAFSPDDDRRATRREGFVRRPQAAVLRPRGGGRLVCGRPVALDADSRLVLSVVVGKRITENVAELLEDVKARLGGRPPERVRSDE